MELVGRDEREVSRTNQISITVPEPSPGGTTTCTFTQQISYNSGSAATLTILRTTEPAPPPPDPVAGTQVFSSWVQMRAFRNNIPQPEAADACIRGLGTNTASVGRLGCASDNTVAPLAFARPGDTISFGWTGQLVALNSGTTDTIGDNWRDFPAFDASLATPRDPVQLRPGLPPGFLLSPPGAGIYPGQPHPLSVRQLFGGPLTFVFGSINLPPAPLNLRNNCTISGTNIQGLAPHCPDETNMNMSIQTHRGSGTPVTNDMLGRRDITQTVTVSDSVSKRFQNCSGGNDFLPTCNQDEHTYVYAYKRRHTRSGTLTAAGNCGCAQWASCCVGGVTCPPNATDCTPVPCTQTTGPVCGCQTWSPGCATGTYSQFWYGGGPNLHPRPAPTASCCNIPAAEIGGGEHDATGSYPVNNFAFVRRVSGDPIRSTAAFGVPYNYRLSGSLFHHAESIVLSGSTISFTANVFHNVAFNADVGETYATLTRDDTEWRITTFYVNASVPSKPLSFQAVYRSLEEDVCSVFAPYAEDCEILPHSSDRGRLSTSRNISGITNPIEDRPIGTKFCMVLSIHNYNVGNRSEGDPHFYGDEGWGETGEGRVWHSAPTCVAIGERPSTQVWAANFFSAGPVRAGFQVRTPIPGTPGAQASIHGTWVEYAALGCVGAQCGRTDGEPGIGRITDLGSGAAFAGGNPGILAGSGFLPNSCRFTKQTVANTTCGGDFRALGEANVSPGLARNIAFRYSRRDANNLPDRWHHVPVGGTVNLTQIINTVAEQEAAGVIPPSPIIYITGGNMDIIAPGGTLRNPATVTVPPGRTVIIDSTGTVTFRANVVYNDGPFTGIHQIPQLLTFAQNINIVGNVNRVDSWILAGLNGGSGRLRTCSEYTPAYGPTQTISGVSDLSGEVCTIPLRVNGPTIANQVLLHRSHFNNSPTYFPASEVFNLRSDAYLWAFAQSENHAQAFVTFSRELAPRF